jgi:hypothetical protein
MDGQIDKKIREKFIGAIFFFKGPTISVKLNLVECMVVTRSLNHGYI